MRRGTIVLFLLICTAALAQPPVPPLWGHRIHDEAHILSTATIDSLEVFLQRFEDSTSNQIAVLIIPSLQGASLEEYSLHVAHDEWKLGQKDKDNGVLLLIAVEDRKMRIEVGKGLEGTLTDLEASRIIRNEIAPAFRDQDYDRGIQHGVTAITRALQGEYTADDQAHVMTWKERLFIGLFVFVILGIFTLLALIQRGCMSWIMYVFFIPFYIGFPQIVLGFTGMVVLLTVYLVGFPLLKYKMQKAIPAKKKGKGKSSRRSGKDDEGGSGWLSTLASWSGSGSGSSSSSGSSFSGGGGSFGGGGSSGSW